MNRVEKILSFDDSLPLLLPFCYYCPQNQEKKFDQAGSIQKMNSDQN